MKRYSIFALSACIFACSGESFDLVEQFGAGSGGIGAAASVSVASSGGSDGGGGAAHATSVTVGVGGEGGVAPPCSMPTDCPAPIGECMLAACIGGACGVVVAPDGAAGLDDGLECTTDTCVGGMTEHQPRDAGTACESSGANVELGAHGECGEASMCVCVPNADPCSAYGVCGMIGNGCGAFANCGSTCGVGVDQYGGLTCDADANVCACVSVASVASSMSDAATAAAACLAFNGGTPAYCGGMNDDIPSACVYAQMGINGAPLYCCL